MKKKTLADLMISSAVMAGLSGLLLITAARQIQFRESIGHDQPAFEKFVAKVENGSFEPETMAGFTNHWFAAMKQDHRMIQVEEQIGDRLAVRSAFIGSLGVVIALFQIYVVYSVRKEWRSP